MPEVRTYSDELNDLISILPSNLRSWVLDAPDLDTLIELVIDLGRPVELRYTNGNVVRHSHTVDGLDLEYIINNLSAFGPDNRVGLPATLHRVSRILDRNHKTVGLTLRVGRVVYGAADDLKKLLDDGVSILLLGKPGAGKTTILRETARILADEHSRRVVVIDTSNEIAGEDGIPHPAIGGARRMQVPTGVTQAHVMIEAVENHMPEVLIIDEIGNYEDVMAARTIAERGVMLVATAHGSELKDLINNPVFGDLIGGFNTVTLTDREALARGSSKTIIERKRPPTFDVIVVIEPEELTVVRDVAKEVSSVLDVQNRLSHVPKPKPRPASRRPGSR